jgi:hypothetical protein
MCPNLKYIIQVSPRDEVAYNFLSIPQMEDVECEYEIPNTIGFKKMKELEEIGKKETFHLVDRKPRDLITVIYTRYFGCIFRW